MPNRNNPNSLDGVTSGALTNNGTVVVNDLTTLWLLGTINNVGTILEGQASTTANTQIRLNSQVVSLQGGGQLVMSNNGGNQIFGQSGFDTLINVNNTISGAGQLGSTQMTLVNATNGVILGNQNPTFLQTGQLTIDTAGNPTNVVLNAGILESTAAGGLLIRDTTVNNTGGTLGSVGTIEAVGAGAVVDLAGATIQGGTLATSGGGVIQTIIEANFSNIGTLDGLSLTPVNNTGTVLVNDQTVLSLLGTINNTGTILVDQESAGGNTEIRLDSQFVTLKGGGQVQMSNNAGGAIFGHVASQTLINFNNTISGAGQLGSSQMTFINQAAGVVDANLSTPLLLNTNGNVATNAGLLEATSGGTLTIQNTTINNQGGTILSSGTGSVVGLQSPNAATTIVGGLVIGTAPIHEQDRGGTLDGQTLGALTIQGTVQIDNSDALALIGTINNTGTILEAGGGKTGSTDLVINSQIVTLTGGGTVLMSNSGAGNGNDRIVAGSNGQVLINVNNTIAGAGQLTIPGNALNVTNEAAGVINANLLGALVIGDSGNNMVTNQGIMEATSTAALNGGLVLLNTARSTMPAGTIRADGSAGSLAFAHVDLNGADVQAGTLADPGERRHSDRCRVHQRAGRVQPGRGHAHRRQQAGRHQRQPAATGRHDRQFRHPAAKRIQPDQRCRYHHGAAHRRPRPGRPHGHHVRRRPVDHVRQPEQRGERERRRAGQPGQHDQRRRPVRQRQHELHQQRRDPAGERRQRPQHQPRRVRLQHQQSDHECNRRRRHGSAGRLLHQ